MKIKIHVQRKITKNSTYIPIQNALASCGFNTQPQAEKKSPRDLETAAQFGHHLSNVSLFAPGTQSSGLPIQPKLTIGKPGDKYEQEADRVAAEVVSRINAPLTPAVQCQSGAKEDEGLQMKPVVQRLATGESMAATPDLENTIQSSRGSGQPLANSIRQPMEQAFGANFEGVRVHTGTQSDQMNQSIQAKAFTTGKDIFFRQGEYNPGNRGGQELIAHELTHVVQQNGGTVQRLSVIQREDENENPHYEGQELKGSISNLQELRKEIENLLDDTFIGVRTLFMAGGVETKVEKWGKLLYGLLSHKNEMGDLEEGDCTEIVKNIKADNRKEEFLRITEFYSYFDGAVNDYPHNLEQFKEKLQRDEVYIEEEDEKIISLIFDNQGDREALTEDPQQAFLIASEEYNLDEKGLKTLLDEELDESVNWGHEISDCMRNSGKKGELYYYQTGKGLTAVGKSSQSHASSKGGKTIIWEESSGTIEILAIGKHTTRGDTSLSKGASYEIQKAFGGDYLRYTNKIVGFKS
ncbi:MAG: DUF4157 domain-containing protein [Scytonematopsis contorta HA4267-MV1]|jgi:hypothetical protein|nr:DUF4157 domain-containing protein [Scytonematopsis contorta HA4267-MV1]